MRSPIARTLLGLLLAGCGAATAAPGDLDLRELPGVQHYRRWSPRIAQGAQPAGDEAFAALRAQGITTLLSVDGAMPDVARAAQHGLAYVHVPIGYDGLSPDEQAAITKAVADSPGPVFVHCHHGLHRGPAAAAIARIAADGVAPEQAVAGLKESGCSPTYQGLFRDVLAFRTPDAAALARLGPLPSAVRPEGVRDAMIHINDRWDFLKASEGAKWALLPQFPDVTPAHEAAMLREGFREMARLDVARGHGEQFMAWTADAERHAGELEQALRAEAAGQAGAAFAALKQTCNACHAAWRD
ncbi:MAG: hypothetical protein FJ296_11245 [Planctomycetes bacterium]|nr:hypothetical protein [Planctomycetota bacterium]